MLYEVITDVGTVWDTTFSQSSYNGCLAGFV